MIGRLLRRILRYLGILKVNKIKRNDVVKFPIQEEVFFLVYWKVLKIGKGPAVTLNIFGNEVLKFDCFGKGKGHFHIDPFRKLRIYFVENSAKDQVKRVKTELLLNAQRYIENHSNAKINSVRLNLSLFQKSVDLVEKTMLTYLFEIDELKDL